MKKSITYADAGVDIDKANDFVQHIKQTAKQTNTAGVIGSIGGFGGLFSLETKNLSNPVLVSSTDGVGTKLKIAFMMDKHDTIGIDLTAMCVNDICVLGAKPLFFLDYISMGKLRTQTAADIIKGIADGCKEAGCALIGGETAEMPGMYNKNEYDLAGFAVGLVDKDNIIDGTKIAPGHKLIGISSAGIHSNGYSLVRKICFETLNLKIDSYIPELGKTIGEELITPTKIYTKTIQSLTKDTQVHGFAHITGGGLTDNILRIIPENCDIEIHSGSWQVLSIFNFLQNSAGISDFEMKRTFNNGIGMAAVVPEENAQKALDILERINEKAWIIGRVLPHDPKSSRIKWK